MIFELIEDLGAALVSLPAGHPQRPGLDSLAAALHREPNYLHRRPTELLPYLMNAANWYDGPGARSEKPANNPAAASDAFPACRPFWNIVARWLAERQVVRPMLRCVTPLSVALPGSLVTVFRGHAGPVVGLALHPDGRRLVTAGDFTVRFWDVDTGRETAAFANQDAPLTTLALSPDSRLVAAGEGSVRNEQTGRYVGSAVRIWETETGAVHDVGLGHGAGVTRLAWSPDGGFLASACNGGKIIVRDVAERTDVNVIKTMQWFPAIAHPQVFRVLHVAWSPDGSRLAIVTGDSRIRMLDVQANCEITAVWEDRCHTTPVFSPDGTRLAFGSDKEIKVCDVATGQPVATFAPQESRIEALVWSPDGAQLASGAWHGAISLWDPQTGRLVKTLAREDGSISGLAFAPDGGRLASALRDTVSIRRLDLSAESAGQKELGHNVNRLAFSPGGELLAAGFANDTVRVRRSDARDDVVLNVPEKPLLTRLMNGPAELRERFAQAHATGSSAAFVALMQSALNKKGLSGSDALEFAFSPDAARLAVAAYDGSIGIWDARSGAQLDVLCGHDRQATSLAWSPDGRLLASGSRHSPAIVWDAQSGREIARLDIASRNVEVLAWSHAGALLAGLRDDGCIRLWRSPSLSPARDLAAPAGFRLDYRVARLRELSFAADDATLAHWEPSWWGAGAKPSALHIWNVATGNLLESSSPEFADARRLLARRAGERYYIIGEALDTVLYASETGQIVAAFPVPIELCQASGDRLFAGKLRREVFVLELIDADVRGQVTGVR